MSCGSCVSGAHNPRCPSHGSINYAYGIAPTNTEPTWFLVTKTTRLVFHELGKPLTSDTSEGHADE